MAVRVQCPNPQCGRTYRVPDERLGQTAACRQCGRTFMLEPLAAQAGRPIRARATTPLERSWRWCRRNRIPAISAAAALLFLGVALVIMLCSGGAPAPPGRQTAGIEESDPIPESNPTAEFTPALEAESTAEFTPAPEAEPTPELKPAPEAEPPPEPELAPEPEPAPKRQPAREPEPAPSAEPAPRGEFKRTPVRTALKGRQMKQQLLAAYGGSDATEAAVMQGLKWLATNQQRDGSWSLTGPYRNGIADSFENRAAATAMALLAFQGAGQTNQVGEFTRECAQGWRWLLKQQDKQGSFFQTGHFHHQFYTMSQCTIALCELYQMTGDETYREPAERAVSHLLDSQADDGGWRYFPGGTDGDTSVTAWVVTALQTARMAGLDVPEDTLRRADRFLDTVAHQDGSQYRYRPNKEPRPSMTAAGLLCRQYLGWARDDPRMIAGVEYLTQPENLIDYQTEPNVYYWYYATQVCHNMGGRYWDTWNEVMRDALPRHQVKTGRERGSWYPSKPHEDAWSREGGRLYVTCLSLYVLETYYRHLPVYADLYQPGEGPLALEAKETTEGGGEEFND